MPSELSQLRNVGPATLADLELLGITSVKQLKQADASDLYQQLKKITQCEHDPCVWDVFAAIIHEAKTGEKTNWWQWTKIRKDNAI